MIACFLFFTLMVIAEEPLKFSDEIPVELIAANVDGAKPADDDPNINASTVTLEAGPSAIVAGCVNAMTGSYFDSGMDLVLPGPQPVIVQHTFCNFLNCHFSHQPSLEVALSKHGNYVHALYTDDNGSGIPYRARLHDHEPENGFLRIPSEARENLTNYSSSEISGRSRWANSCIKFARGIENKHYHLLLGSGTRRIFERYERIGEKHQPGVPIGKFRLIEENTPNGNKYLYSYDSHKNLKEVKAINSRGFELANLKCNTVCTDATFNKTVFSIGNMSVAYTGKLASNSTFLIEPSQGMTTLYEREGFFLLRKYQNGRQILKVNFIPGFNVSSLNVSTLSAPVGTTDEMIPIYRFSYGRDHSKGCTIVRNAYNFRTSYNYNSKHKRLNSIETYDKHEHLLCKERFYWHKPKMPFPAFPFKDKKDAFASHIPSEHLLKSQSLEGKGIFHFCRHLEYDNFGNITKNHLWGNLTGLNHHPLILKDGIPVENGCEAYTKIRESSQDGLNLLLYEEDNRKWVRQSYFPKTNLLQVRLTGSGALILKREFFQYDENGTLIEEIWDDGSNEDQNNLEGVTERHIRRTVPRTETPKGLPQIVREYYYDLASGENCLIKQLINEHSPEGKILVQHHYDSDGAIVYMLNWKYDRLGNVLEETNALGEKITRKFDRFGNKILQQGPRPDVHTHFDYDHANRLIKEEEIWDDGQIFVTTHGYNLLNQKISTIDPNNQETLFFYDRLGNLKKTILPSIETPSGEWIYPSTETRYNAMGQAVASRDANGHWTKKEYTIRGQICKIEYPDGSCERKEYSLDGLLVKEIAKNGLSTCYAHDSFGNVILTEKYNAQGELLSTATACYNTFHVLSETDEAGLTTSYEYDGAGRCIAVKKGDKLTTYDYDSLGRIIGESSDGITHTKQYNQLDRVIEERIEHNGKTVTKKQYQYDCQGNRTHEIIYTHAGISTQKTSYNPHNEPTAIQDALGYITHISYDTIERNGQKVKRITTTDPLGNQEIKIYDTQHRLSKSSRHNAFGKLIQSEKHHYDAVGQKRRTTANIFNGDAYSRTIITEWDYDCMGNMTCCTEAKNTPEQKVTRLDYNLHGEKEQIIKPDGTVLFHQYDDFGRLKQFYSSDQTINYAYTYDVKNNPVRIEDKVHETATIRSYDKLDRLTLETLDTGFTLAYTYDSLDRPLIITLPDQTEIRYVYNGHYLARIDRVKNNQVAYSHSYTKFDKAENLLGMDLPGQAGAIEFEYDLMQRLTTVKAPHWQEIIPPNGYDAAGNLLKRQVSDTKGTIDYRYTYDDLYQLTSEEGHLSNTYANDSLCNRVAKNDQPYILNDLNQIVQQTDCTYIYDANGNLRTIKQGDHKTIFVYDALDRLIQVKKGAECINYRYDSFHRRLSKVHNGIATHYIYLKENEIGAINGNTFKELRVLGLGKGAEIGAAVAIELDGTPYVPIHDPYGNVVTLLDLQGQEITSYRYTAFGEEQISGELTNPWRYSSKRVDPETGFIYFGRRYYMPLVGRWLTPDPLGFADGPNLYAYVHNRPMICVDPDGQYAILISLAISFAIDLCMPTVIAGLSEYAAGGAIAASLVSGLATGYTDPICSAFDSSTYSMGDADLASFVCNRAGMMLGAAIACRRPANLGNKGIQTITNVAGREIAGTVISKAETALAKSVATSLQKSVKTTAQKTAVAAEHYIFRDAAKLGKQSSNPIIQIENKISEWLGSGSKLIKNKAGDTILLSNDMQRRVRFDFLRPSPHNNPHMHVEEIIKGEWIGPRIYPTNVPHN